MIITKRVEFDAAHRLPGHPGKCNNLHGHRYSVVAGVGGEPGEDGMVVDFGTLSSEMHQVIDDLDHSTLLWVKDSLVKTLRDHALRVNTFSGPPTAECLAEFIYTFLVAQFGVGPIQYVEVYETPTCCARYSG